MCAIFKVDFSDIPGADVSVWDENQDLLVIGHVDKSGKQIEGTLPGSEPVGCVYSFTAYDLPVSASTYRIEIAARGQLVPALLVSYSNQEMTARAAANQSYRQWNVDITCPPRDPNDPLLEICRKS